MTKDYLNTEQMFLRDSVVRYSDPHCKYYEEGITRKIVGKLRPLESMDLRVETRTTFDLSERNSTKRKVRHPLEHKFSFRHAIAERNNSIKFTSIVNTR